MSAGWPVCSIRPWLPNGSAAGAVEIVEAGIVVAVGQPASVNSGGRVAVAAGQPLAEEQRFPRAWRRPEGVAAPPWRAAVIGRVEREQGPLEGCQCPPDSQEIDAAAGLGERCHEQAAIAQIDLEPGKDRALPTGGEHLDRVLAE